MVSTKANIAANFVGKSWATLIGIVSIPLFLVYLSVESFGLVGIFASVQAILGLLDLGFGSALAREVARLSAFPDRSQELRNLVRSIELPYWGISVLLGLICLAIAPLISRYWVNPNTLDERTISYCFMVMGVGFSFQWACNLALGGLLALQRQLLTNWINAVSQTIRAGGALFVLIYISPTIFAFLLWQTIWTIVYTIFTIFIFWRYLPKGTKPNFDYELLKGIWRFATGMLGIGIVTLVLTQLDKIILSKILTLEIFGYYTLATTVSSVGIGIVVSSISMVYYPRFSQLVAKKDENGIRSLYHQASQVMSVFLIPATSVMVCYSYQIMMIWTQNENLANNTSKILALAALGSGCNGLMHIPFFVQLAHGYTKFAFWQNVAMIIVLTPIMVILCFEYGAIGAVAAWAALNLLYLIIGMQILNRIILTGELLRWYLNDLGKPALAAISIVVASKLLLSVELPRFASLAFLVVISVIAVFGAILASPEVRSRINLNFGGITR